MTFLLKCSHHFVFAMTKIIISDYQNVGKYFNLFDVSTPVEPD